MIRVKFLILKAYKQEKILKMNKIYEFTDIIVHISGNKYMLTPRHISLRTFPL